MEGGIHREAFFRPFTWPSRRAPVRTAGTFPPRTRPASADILLRIIFSVGRKQQDY